MSNNDYNKQDLEPEVPIFIIETDEDDVTSEQLPAPSKSTVSTKWLIFILLLLLSSIIAYVGYQVWERNFDIGIGISVSPRENIKKLERPIVDEAPQVILTQDTVLDVGLNIYELHGLQAGLETKRPSEKDQDVYLYCCSADYTAPGQYLGSLVLKGKEQNSSGLRLGYMAMHGGNNVIGISKSEKVKKYIVENGGDFFRQFILLSDGEMPLRYYLHGKVERCAMGRTENDQLFFITSQHKVTMRSFASALREYGFVDAIYITGGGHQTFYRDASGKAHDVFPGKTQGNHKGLWLVFRRRG